MNDSACWAEELIGFALDRKPLFEVGQGFKYTDSGYLVLGRLIESATGRTYYELLHERILGPQKLDDVYPADRSVSLQHGESNPRRRDYCLRTYEFSSDFAPLLSGPGQTKALMIAADAAVVACFLRQDVLPDR